MMPYGYHNTEIYHSNGDDRRNAREAIRQAKLVRQRALSEEVGSQPHRHSARIGAWRRVVAPVVRLTAIVHIPRSRAGLR
jgi:hypothetical protein